MVFFFFSFVFLAAITEYLRAELPTNTFSVKCTHDLYNKAQPVGPKNWVTDLGLTGTCISSLSCQAAPFFVGPI